MGITQRFNGNIRLIKNFYKNSIPAVHTTIMLNTKKPSLFTGSPGVGGRLLCIVLLAHTSEFFFINHWNSKLLGLDKFAAGFLTGQHIGGLLGNTGCRFSA